MQARRSGDTRLAVLVYSDSESGTEYSKLRGARTDEPGRPALCTGGRCSRGDGMVSMKEVSLVVMCLQNGATPLIMRWAMTGAVAANRFDTAQAVLVQEFLKILMSLVLLAAEEEWVPASWVGVLVAEVFGKPRETLKLAIPAVLYFILNMCLQLAAAELPAAIFQVSYQGKTLVVALFSVILLSKQLTRIQWMAILFMGLGLAIVQLGKSSEGKQTASSEEQNVPKGLLIVLLGCSCSGLAGVYFEKIMKGVPGGKDDDFKPTSMWVRNVQLAGFSCLIGVIQYCYTVLVGTSKPFLYGFEFHVWVMIFNNAIGGLCVAVVIKYADNILKGFATALATVWAAIASVPLFGFTISPQFGVGTMVVLGSTMLYGGTLRIQGAYWNSEPELCRKMRGPQWEVAEPTEMTKLVQQEPSADTEKG